MGVELTNKMIVVIGSFNTDLILRVPRIPGSGETVLGGKFLTAAGGKGANQAVAAARAGGDVAFMARIGNDSYGRQAMIGFRKERINTIHVSVDENEPSGVALIFVSEEGENSIGVAPGANSRLSAQDILAAEETIASADSILIQLEIPLKTVETAAKIAMENGVRVILNPAPAQALDRSLLQKVSILTPNESEAQMLSGITINSLDSARRAGSELVARGPKTVLITLGCRGALIVEKNRSELIPGFKVEVVDTTAAGDVFNGALTVALAQDLELKNAVQFANAAAALSVTRIGAQPSAPFRKDIVSLLKSKKTSS